MAEIPKDQPVDTSNNETASPPKNHRSRVLWWSTSILIILGLVWLCLWFFYFRFYESTDDAYANGNMISLNSAVSGSVVAFFADDTDLVIEGQLLVQLDRTEYEIKYEKALAALASTVLQVRQLYDNVSVNQANVNSRFVTFSKASYDFENRSQLIDSKAISNEDFIHSKDDLTIAELQFKQAEYQLQEAQSAAGNTPIEKHPSIEQKKASVREAFYNLQHCSIYSPYTGFVAQRAVEVGQWVNPNTSLLAIIPKNYVWVDANFKETQLTYMRIGQPATVWFDLYGSGVKFEGKVLGIASGTGSIFSLIPPQNATGNWIKIVQRLPVRISLDAETLKNYPTRLGISANVDVNITNQDLPKLAQTPPTKHIAVTSVFDLNFDEVEKVIAEVILANMKSK